MATRDVHTENRETAKVRLERVINGERELLTNSYVLHWMIVLCVQEGGSSLFFLLFDRGLVSLVCVFLIMSFLWEIRRDSEEIGINVRKFVEFQGENGKVIKH